MGSEGMFAVALQRALENIFRVHDETVSGLHKNNRLLLLEVRKLKAGLTTSRTQVEQLYKQVQQLSHDKQLLEDLRKNNWGRK